MHNATQDENIWEFWQAGCIDLMQDKYLNTEWGVYTPTRCTSQTFKSWRGMICICYGWYYALGSFLC